MIALILFHNIAGVMVFVSLFYLNICKAIKCFNDEQVGYLLNMIFICCVRLIFIMVFHEFIIYLEAFKPFKDSLEVTGPTNRVSVGLGGI